METRQKRRKFYAITAIALVAIFVVAVAILEYVDYSYVNVEIMGAPNTSFVLTYDSTNVTLPASQDATVAVLPHANVTITALTAPYSVVSGWEVTGVSSYHSGGKQVNFLTGSGGTTVHVSIELSNKSAASA